MPLDALQSQLQNGAGFPNLQNFYDFSKTFLRFAKSAIKTRIVSPSTPNYIFYQYDSAFASRITRPLNTDLFIEEPREFADVLESFHDVLDLIRSAKGDPEAAVKRHKLDAGVIDKIVYTVQQCIGCVGDSLPNANQSRKRVGMLFEQLVTRILGEVGVACEPRTISIPLPGHENMHMSYQLDLVFSRGQAIVAKPDKLIAENEIVGSVKTTSKDRLDKVFLDKFLLSRLLKRDIRVVAIFLHDVQRAVRKKGQKSGEDLFAVNSTFKSNHFLGYTLALNRLDGVYYVDPRPIMARKVSLASEIGVFSKFITRDLWRL